MFIPVGYCSPSLDVFVRPPFLIGPLKMRQLYALETLGNGHLVTVRSVPAERKSLDCNVWQVSELAFQELLTRCLDKGEVEFGLPLIGWGMEGEPRNSSKFLVGKPVGRWERK
jgi:hypothetical protein